MAQLIAKGFRHENHVGARRRIAIAEQVQRIKALASHLDDPSAKAGFLAAGLSAEVFEQSPDKGNGHAVAQAGQ